MLPLAEKTEDPRHILDHSGAGEGGRAVSGSLAVIGLGPGAANQITPEATAVLAAASDIRLSALSRPRAAPRANTVTSDNREEHRPPRRRWPGRRGRAVAVVSGGDPGVFAMAAAVCETSKPATRMARVRRHGCAGDHRHVGGGRSGRRAARA